MNIYKATIEEVLPDFGIKAFIQIWDNALHQAILTLRGVDAPPLRSKKARAMRRHIEDVVEQTSFLVIKVYEKDPRHRYPVDVFYLEGEEDPEKVVENGRCLNQELLELDLALPFDEKRRQIDFSQKRIAVFDKEIDLVTGNFKAEVCMYINDCKQYLRSAIEKKPVDMDSNEFVPTDEEFLIIYGLKELKDMSMTVAGRARLNWKGN